MLTTALLILFFSLVLAGVGLLLPGAAFRCDPSLDRLFAAFWSGMALILAFLQLWHFFRRVDALALLLVLAASALGWYLARRALRPALAALRPVHAAWAALAVIPALVLANHVMFVPAHSDHGLYHLQTVKWISQYAIVPGLGNLHHRLAFNNANFLLAALLNAGPLAGRAYYTANTLLAFALILQCGAAVVSLLIKPATPQPNRPALYQVYYALMLVPVIWQVSTTHLPGYSPDVPVFALQVVLGGELLRLFGLGGQRERFIPQARLLALLVGAGIAVKLSFIMFGALVLLVVIGLWLARFGFNFRRDLTVWLGWAGLVALLALPWMARGAVLSGYLFYPTTALPLPLAWRIPLHLAEPVAGVISAWARTASSQIPYTADLAWFLNWQRFLVYEARIAFVVSLAALALDGLLALARRGQPRTPTGGADLGGPLALLAISAVSLVYWFLLAPDYRFSGAVFWTLLISALLIGYAQLAVDISPVSTAPASALALSLVIALALWLAPNQFSKNLSPRLLLNPVLEPALAARYQTPDQAQVRTTASGVRVYTPAQNGQSCWNLPLPCVPSNDFTSQLHLFAPGNLQKGFYIQK